MQTLSTIWTSTRDDLRTRRLQRAEARRLERELSAYTSPADRAELDAIIARHPEADVAEVEAVVTRLRAA